jgi:hypothetical protein
MMRSLLTCGFALGILMQDTGAPARAQEVKSNVRTATADEKSPVASIGDLAWIAGHWQGSAMGGQFEETWNAPLAGSMLGMFKFVKDGQVGFYELLIIEPLGESLTLRIKHFSSDLQAWEEKDKFVEFRLLKLTDREALFDGLTFRKSGPHEMEIFVRITQEGAAGQEIRFPCRRVTGVGPSSAKARFATGGKALALLPDLPNRHCSSRGTRDTQTGHLHELVRCRIGRPG